MARLTFPDTLISTEEMARSIRRDLGKPEPPDPNELYWFKVEIERTMVVMVRAMDEDNAEQRCREGRYGDSNEEIVEEYIRVVQRLKGKAS